MTRNNKKLQIYRGVLHYTYYLPITIIEMSRFSHKHAGHGQ